MAAPLTRDASIQPEPPAAAALKRALEAAQLASVPLVCLCLGVYFSFIGVAHALLLPPSAAAVMAPTAWSSAIVFLGFTLYLRRWSLPSEYAHPVAALVAMLVLANCLLHLGVTAESKQTTNILLLLLAGGAFFVSRAWFIAVELVTVAGWVFVFPWDSAPDERTHWSVGVGISAIFALVILTVRRRWVLQLEEIKLESERRNQKLQEALSVSKREVQTRVRAQSELERSRRFAQRLLDALADHIAVLDEEGRITAVNAAWQRFGDANQLRTPRSALGLNYLVVCDAAQMQGETDAALAAAGIRGVLAGEREEFSFDYACPDAPGPVWYHMRVTRFADTGRTWAVVAHEDISARKQAEGRVGSADPGARGRAGPGPGGHPRQVRLFGQHEP